MLLVPSANVASAQAAGPEWKLTVTPNADYFLPGPIGENNVYTLEAENVSATESTAGAIRLEDVLPEGLTATGIRLYASPVGFNNNAGDELAAKGYCPTFLKCEYPGTPAIGPGEKLVMEIRVAVPAEPDPSGPLGDLAKVTGGGALKATATATNEAATDPPIGFHAFESPLTDSSGNLYTQAGGHPSRLLTDFVPATRAIPETQSPVVWRSQGLTPVQDPRDVYDELPPGLIGNPQAVPTCPLATFFLQECELKDVVGDVGLKIEPPGEYQGGVGQIIPLFNLKPSASRPGELGYAPLAQAFFLTAGLRSGSDYGITLTSAGDPPVTLTRVHVVTWGVPADPEHNEMRGKICVKGSWTENFIQSVERIERECEEEPGSLGNLHGGPAGVPPTPFLTLPTQCSGEPLSFAMRYDVWQNAEEARATYEDPATTACSQLHFEPTIEAHPTTNLADAPSGLEFDLHVTQGCWKEEGAPSFQALCQSDLREAVVTLPRGLAVNPSSANGLAACSPAQVGITTPVGQTPAHFTEAPANCPAASKLGTAVVETPLLHEPLGAALGENGSVYLATPHQNPFNSLLAAYIVLEGQGVTVKLAGRFQTDPLTGQITGRFTENPQTPFEDFHLRFFGGARGDLRTPPTCGSYETTAVLTPYSAPESGPPAEPTSSFELDNGGAACPHNASEQPNSPVFRAGTESPQAGAFSPFSLRLARADGSQEIAKIETILPPGLSGKLAGIAECSETQLAIATSREHEGGGAEEQANPACPASSEVGTVEVASGAGPTPLYVKGHAYLAGPYKSAPLSLAIVTPAVAGPFDLGDVLVRTALYVNPETAQIKAVSDPIPHILSGIPLDVRSITLSMNRPDFTLNPTNCSELGFTGAETSVLNATAPLSQRFQVGGCQSLGFSPQLSLRLKGSPKRAHFPALTATLTMPTPGLHSLPCKAHAKKHRKRRHCRVSVPQQANVAAAQVTLPGSENLEQGHIKGTCGRPQLAAHSCPANSVYGHATAVSPLLGQPLSGPVYLVTGFPYQLPALVADLNGQIEVTLIGKVDTGRDHGIRNSFEVVPDAPVSRFTLSMFGGKRGLIVNEENLCGKHARRRALADFTAQNGRVAELEPTVANGCKKKHRKGHRKHRAHKRGHGTAAQRHARGSALAAWLRSAW